MVKFIITTISFILFCISSNEIVAQAVVQFKQKSKISLSYFGNAFVHDRNHIFLSGTAPFSYWIYTFETDTWEKVRLPSKHKNKKAKSQMAGFIPAYNKAVFFGNPIEIIDTGTLELQTIEIEGGYPILSGSAEKDDKIFLFGGTLVNLRRHFVDLIETNQLFAFDLVNKKLDELSPMPYKVTAKGKFIDNKLYVPGGYNSERSFNTILCYEPHENEWSVAGYLPEAIRNYAIATNDESIFLMGCEKKSGYLGIYNPAKNTYLKYATNLPYINGSLIYREGKLYFFGGRKPHDSKFLNNHLYVFDLKDLPSAPLY